MEGLIFAGLIPLALTAFFLGRRCRPKDEFWDQMIWCPCGRAMKVSQAIWRESVSDDGVVIYVTYYCEECAGKID